MDEARSVIIDKEQGSGSDKGLHSAPRDQQGQLVFCTSAKLLGLLWLRRQLPEVYVYIPAGLCWLRHWLHEVYVCKPAGVVVAETVAARGVGLRL